MFSNSLRLKKHSSASCNKTSLHINQSPNKSRLWITDYWLQKSCWSTLMETINRVVNCCSWGMKGRKLLRWRESNESRVEFGRFRDGRQTRKCLSLMGCLLMVEAVRMWWVTMVHGGWRWIRGYFIHVLVLSFLCSSHSFHALVRFFIFSLMGTSAGITYLLAQVVQVALAAQGYQPHQALRGSPVFPHSQRQDHRRFQDDPWPLGIPGNLSLRVCRSQRRPADQMLLVHPYGDTILNTFDTFDCRASKHSLEVRERPGSQAIHLCRAFRFHLLDLWVQEFQARLSLPIPS